MPFAWLRRNVFQHCDGGPLLRTIYLATLVCPMSIPSLSSSPWIRGAPHNGMAMLISRISCRISVDGLDHAWTPAPKQPEACTVPPHHGIGSNDGERVAGLRKQAAPRINLSTAKNDIRFGSPRRNTMICCLSTRTSASSAARDRNRSTTKPKISLQRSHIKRRIVRFSADYQPDQIYDRDSLAAQDGH